ncbi:MAG TPA: LuxR family transcriptional regulator [Casimicrobiaceae bacterium]|nr:LuxR family transcriptional regulator [Casimicrobiaceae bacterium]
MLHKIDIKPDHVLSRGRNLNLLHPLTAAARTSEDLVDAVRKIVSRWGFDSFVCGFGSIPRPTRSSQLYVFATLPDEWLRIYEANDYVEVDPRIEVSFDRPSMSVWSGADLSGRSARLDAFLRDASQFGIRSGACFTIHNAFNDRILIGYNSSRTELTFQEVEAHLGDLYAFGVHFHEVFMASVIERGLPSRLRGARLTPREIEALTYVACGLTARDIAPKMSITPRTVRFHVDSACTKMGVLNREEAIALAVKGGLISVFP